MWLWASNPHKPHRVQQRPGSGLQWPSRGRGPLARRLTALQPQAGCRHTGSRARSPPPWSKCVPSRLQEPGVLQPQELGDGPPCPRAVARLEGAGTCQFPALRGCWAEEGAPSRGSPSPSPNPSLSCSPERAPASQLPDASMLGLPRPDLGSPSRGDPAIPAPVSPTTRGSSPDAVSSVPRRRGCAPSPVPRHPWSRIPRRPIPGSPTPHARFPASLALHPRFPEAPVPQTPPMPRPRFPPTSSSTLPLPLVCSVSLLRLLMVGCRGLEGRGGGGDRGEGGWGVLPAAPGVPVRCRCAGGGAGWCGAALPSQFTYGVPGLHRC